MLADTSYSDVSTNYVSPVEAEKKFGNGFISFYDHHESPSYNGGPGVLGRFATTTYPMNSNYWPSHALNFEEEMMWNQIMSYSYTPGILTLDLLYYTRGGTPAEWSVEMEVTEYSDGTIELSVTNRPNTTLNG